MGSTNNNEQRHHGAAADSSTTSTEEDLPGGGGAAAADPDELWYIHGKAYDLRNFVHLHPGGADALIATQGRDCTALFESYHAFVDRPHAMLAKMKEVQVSPDVLASRVLDVSKRGWFRLADGRTDPFWAALKERCRQRLKETGEPRTMPWIEFLYCMSLLATFVTLYYYAYLRGSFRVSAAIAPVMGVVAWLLARLGHDGSHFSVSRIPLVNAMSHTLGTSLLGNPSYWLLLHSVAHHSETNQPSDPDVYHFDYVLRMHPGYPEMFWHRFQVHRWWVFGWWMMTVYGLTTEEPIRMLLVGSGTAPNPGIRLTKNRPWFWVRLAAHLVLYWVFGLLLPVYYKYYYYYHRSMPLSATFPAQFGVLATSVFTAGFCFGLFSQMNHFTEGSVAASEKNTSWAVQQVETACNFCPDSLLWDVLSSGINIQIEHHLFPSLSVQRLKTIVPVVRDTCREFGVDYQCFKSFSACLASTLRHLDSLATDDRASKVFGIKEE